MPQRHYRREGYVPQMPKVKLMPFFTVWTMFLLTFSSCQKKEEGISPSLHTLTEAVYSSVTIVPKKSYAVYPAVTGIVESSSLEEGKLVLKDEVLLRVKGEQADWEHEKARLQYEQARRNHSGNEAILQEITERIRAAGSKLKADSSLYARQSRLWQQNIGSRQAYEAAQLRYETSLSQFKELRKSYSRTQRELAAQVELTEATLRQRASAKFDYEVRSRFNGTVYDVFVEPGESVTPQTPLATIGSTDDFIIRLSIDETDVARITPGQELVVSLDAYQGVSFTAEITKIAPQKDAKTQTYTAEATFKRSPNRLFAGLSGEANIILSRRENVLVLPTAFIGADETVLTATGKQRIVTGMTDFQYTEIVSGLDTGAVVYQTE